MKSAVEALEAVSAPLLGTVFTMVPASGPRAYAQYNSYYRTEEPVLPNGQNGHRYRAAPSQPEQATRHQPSRSGEQL